MRQSDWVAAAVIVVSAMGAGALSISNANAEKQILYRYKTLDQSNAVAFRTAAECVTFGLSQSDCDRAAEVAKKSKPRNELSYSTPSACAAAHGVNACESRKLLADVGTIGLNILFPSTRLVTDYVPRVTGFQTTAHNVTQSVPLYASAQGQHVAVRGDGKIISFSHKTSQAPQSAP